MEKFLKWIDDHKKLAILICVVLIFAPILIIHLLFKWNSGCYWIQADWDSGDILGYFGDVLSFIGTVALGLFAVSQTEKANKINEDLLKLEKKKLVPHIDLKDSQLYHIYLRDEIYQVLKKHKREDAMIINTLYWGNPRGAGGVTDVALLEFKLLNNGGSNIKHIYAASGMFYLSVAEPYGNNGNQSYSSGNSSFSIGEEKTVLIHVKREFATDEEFNDKWYDNNTEKLMPYMEFEFTLETTLGEEYSQRIKFVSGWDNRMEQSEYALERELAIIK